MDNSPLRPPPPHTPMPAAEPTTPANWVGAIAAALAMQIVAAMMMAMAVGIVLVAAFSTWGDSTPETPAFILFAAPVAVVALALYVLSGRVAARIVGDRRGWLMLLGGPVILVTLRLGTVLLAG